MRDPRVFVARSLFLLTTVLSPVNVALAALDRFDPYVYAKTLYDSNIFRVSGDFDNEESDTIYTLGAGLNSDLKLSRQHLLLDIEVDRAKYDSQDNLDNTRVDGRGAWAWQVGNLWSGDLGYSYKRVLSSFDQQLTREKDMRTTQTGFFSTGYQIHPDWEIIGGLEYSEASYQERGFLDRDTASGNFEVQYRNTRNTRVGMRVKRMKNDLREREFVPGVFVDNDYDVTTVSGVFYWQGSAKSSLEANLGYTDLSYNDLDDRDFQGTTGRLKFRWVVTGKTKLNIAMWRETSSLYDEITAYVLRKGASISPTWSVTQKISITGKIYFNNDDFKGRNDIAIALGGQRRDDDIRRYSIGANWRPRDYLKVSLKYRREERDSSINSLDFDDDLIDATVRYDF